MGLGRAAASTAPFEKSSIGPQIPLGFFGKGSVHHVARSTPTEGAAMDPTKIDALGTRLAQAAMTVVVRTCREQVARATHEELDAVCAAMRARSRPAIDRLIDDAKAAPWIAEAAFTAAALDLAQAGIAALRRP
jgi:hypothetical protein